MGASVLPAMVWSAVGGLRESSKERGHRILDVVTSLSRTLIIRLRIILSQGDSGWEQGVLDTLPYSTSQQKQTAKCLGVPLALVPPLGQRSKRLFPVESSHALVDPWLALEDNSGNRPWPTERSQMQALATVSNRLESAKEDG